MSATIRMLAVAPVSDDGLAKKRPNRDDGDNAGTVSVTATSRFVVTVKNAKYIHTPKATLEPRAVFIWIDSTSCTASANHATAATTRAEILFIATDRSGKRNSSGIVCASS